MLAAIRRASSLGGINLYSRRTSGDFRMALPMDLLHFSDCSLMECCIRLHQHVILVNINCVDLGIVTYQNAAAQSKKERFEVMVAYRLLDVRADDFHVPTRARIV
jgi:hypothetical protein